MNKDINKNVVFLLPTRESLGDSMRLLMLLLFTEVNNQPADRIWAI